MGSEDFQGDFSDVKVENVTPKFTILRPASAKRLSLVIDTSGSMNGVCNVQLVLKIIFF